MGWFFLSSVLSSLESFCNKQLAALPFSTLASVDSQTVLEKLIEDIKHSHITGCCTIILVCNRHCRAVELPKADLQVSLLIT